MPIEKHQAMNQLSAVLTKIHGSGLLTEFAPQWNTRDAEELIALGVSAVQRLAPKDTYYTEQIRAMLRDTDGGRFVPKRMDLQQVTGLVQGLFFEYSTGCLDTIKEIIHRDLFTDFLEMAEHLLEEGHTDPAIVYAGGVLEEHIRKLCAKNHMDVTFTDSKGKVVPKRLDAMNTDLAKNGTYPTATQKQVTAWASIRNDAAHGHYDKHEAKAVKLMVDGIKLLIATYPA
jgi:hypothetical protein